MNQDRPVKPELAQPPPADLTAYTDRIARLAERVRAMNEADWSPTPKRREAEALAVRLVDLADYLDSAGTLQFDLEELHDRPPPSLVGEDGYPRPDGLAESLQCSYKATIWRMRDLADSARHLTDELPDPRRKAALPFAIMGFLHLRHRYGFPRPTLYAAGPAVAELAALVERAGIHLSVESLRNALSAGLKDFDPFLIPPGLHDYL
jgi:hypothetical protein